MHECGFWGARVMDRVLPEKQLAAEEPGPTIHRPSPGRASLPGTALPPGLARVHDPAALPDPSSLSWGDGRLQVCGVLGAWSQRLSCLRVPSPSIP